MLSFKDISVKIGERKLFSIENLELDHGLFALVGRNGTGKTTFLNTILQQHRDYEGEILLNNKLLGAYSKPEIAKKIAVVYTKPEVFGNHTVKEVLKLGRIPYQNPFAGMNKEDLAIIDEVAKMLDLENMLDRVFNTLSDGEKQMVMIGRVLVQDTDIVLLDEPGAFLDLVNRYNLFEMLEKIAKETRKLVIFSTHHIDLLEKYCDGILLISNDKMRAIHEKNAYISSIKAAFNIES